MASLLEKLDVYCLFAALLLLILLAAPARADISTGLVGWWRFDEASGITARDASGNGNTGTLTGMAEPSTPTSGWNPGKFDFALSFDGTNDYVDAGSSENLKLSQGGSLAAWVKINNFSGSYGNTIIMKGDGASWANLHYVLFETSGTDRIVFSVSDGTDFLGSALRTATLVANTWYHIAGVWDSVTKRIYLDGVLQQSLDSGIMPKGTMTNCHVNIGRSYSDHYYFNGLIDDVRIYNRALTVDDVLQLYNNGGPTAIRNAVIRNAVVR